MLVLTRIPGEEICISTPEGERIKVVVIGIKGEKIRLGIKANPFVRVHRAEVQEEIDRRLVGVDLGGES